jgi:hypothetical protein
VTELDQIKTAIADLWPSLDGNDADWTLETFKELTLIGDAAGYEVRYTNKAADHREWLWDLVWLERSSSGRALSRLRLAVESEWTLQNVVYDFEKLLVAHSPLRLMIFQTVSAASFSTKAEELQRLSAQYTGNPGVILLAGWVYGQRPQTPVFASWAAE